MAHSPTRRSLAPTAVTVAYLSFIGLQVAVLVPTYLVFQPAAGSIGNTVVGTVGLLCMMAMHVYSIARRSQPLRRVMRLSWWLHLHIYLGLQGIFLAYLHSLPLLWRNGPPILLNPGMLNLYALTVVFLSGLFGRYLFAQVPKTIGGQHLTVQALEAEIAALPQEMPTDVVALWTQVPSRRGFFGMVAAGRARGEALRSLAKMALPPEQEQLAARRIVLERQRAVMKTARRFFSRWIVVHRPVAAALYLITAVHVVLGILYTPWSEVW